MKNRNVILSIFVLALLFLAFFIRRWNEPVKKEIFDRSPASIIYTKHALCRMQCRQIDKEEINEILKKGLINFNKTNKHDRPCPTFALQGRTSSGESLRVIFAQCENQTKVITCYNLEQEFECDCSVNESKKQKQKEFN